MPRVSREDEPGSWHHVMNRGIAKRTLFERREDFRRFLTPLACAVRRGEIEVHSYCLMGTHYHMLVRSPRGELARAMQRVQLTYSRWFNRSRRRDGGLVRGRYTSKPVDTLEYRRTLVQYIDANPCRAGIVGSPEDYPYGSAYHYARTGRPPWLERSWVEGVVQAQTACLRYVPGSYGRVFGAITEDLVEIVETRFARGLLADPLGNLVAASPEHVRRWMVRKARLADGTEPDLPVVALSRLEQLVGEKSHEPWTIGRGRQRRDAWSVVLAGLGRTLCGASLTRLTRSLEVSHSTVSKLCQLHVQELLGNPEYSKRAALLAHSALDSWRSA